MASELTSGKMPGHLGDAVRYVRQALAGAGVAEPDIEARRLVEQACGLSSLVLATQPERALTEAERTALAPVLARRMRREPLARIAGEREFYGRRFRLCPDTLEPRPDTETLIDAVLEIVAGESWRERPLEILDLGTGTGCILLTLLAELPNARGLGTDSAPGAVATAADNSRRLGLAPRARFEVRDGTDGLAGRFDLVASNPPYIRSGDIGGLASEVRVFDPRAALDGGNDGLAFYRDWIPAALRLAPSGWVVLEIGAGQSDAVARALASGRGVEADHVRRWQDLAGHTRVVAIGPQKRGGRD